MPATTETVKTKVDPRKLAEQMVDRLFGAITGSVLALEQGSFVQADEVCLDFEAVERALAVAEERAAGPAKDDDELDVRSYMHAREAAYLLGVQVGLRLRQPVR